VDVVGVFEGGQDVRVRVYVCVGVVVDGVVVNVGAVARLPLLGRGLVGADELDALRLLQRGGVVFGDGVGGAQGFRLVHGAHVFGQGVGAREGAVAFWRWWGSACSAPLGFAVIAEDSHTW